MIFVEPFTTNLAGTYTRIRGASGAVSVAPGGTQGTASGSFTGLTFRPEHDTGSPDMFAEMDIPTSFSDQDRSIGIMTRVGTGATATGYLFDINDLNNRYRFGYFNAGSYVNITGFVTQTITTPTKMRLESEGATHRVYLGSWTTEQDKPSPLATYNDSAISVGSYSAIDVYNANNVIRIDNFRTGALVDLAPSTPLTQFFLGCM